MILCVTGEYKVTNASDNSDSEFDFLIRQDDDVFIEGLFVVKDAVKHSIMPFVKSSMRDDKLIDSAQIGVIFNDWFGGVLESIHDEIKRSEYAFFVDCRSVDSETLETEFFISYHSDFVNIKLIKGVEEFCHELGISVTLDDNYQPYSLLMGVKNLEMLSVAVNRSKYSTVEGMKSEHYNRIKRTLYVIMKYISDYEKLERRSIESNHLSEDQQNDQGESAMFNSFISKKARNLRLFQLVDDPSVSDQFIMAEIKQIYGFIVDEIIWVASNVCDLPSELINDRIVSALFNFIDAYKGLDTRSPTRAPSPSGLLRFHLERCVYVGRCEKTDPIVTRPPCNEYVDL
jgi:hypothetical protein